jgi:phage gp29-like protein
MKLWVSESKFVEIDRGDTPLSVEIASRSRSVDWLGVFGFLPDPDDVLQKLGQDLAVYRQLLSDAHVGSCYLSRKSGVLSCEWDIREPANNPRRVNTRVMEAICRFMDRIDVYQVITDMLEAPFFGISPCEVIWQATEGLWLPDRVVGKPTEWFAFTEDNQMRFKSRDNMIEGEVLPPCRFLTARHHASYRNPYGDRLLSRCFWPVTFKRGGWKCWSIFTEKYGMPWAVGKVPRSTNATDRATLVTNLGRMIQDAVAVINNDESIELKEAGGKAASADIFDKLLSAANREISKAILGQTLSTEIDKGGSFAASKSHMEVRADLVAQDKRMVKGCFDQLFTWVTELNFSGASAPEFVFHEDEDIQGERAERDENLKTQGVGFTKIYYQRRYNLEEDEFEMAAAAQSPEGGNAAHPVGALEYAEDRKFTPGQQAIEEMIDSALPMAARHRDVVTSSIMEAVQASTSWDDLQERLTAVLADQMPAEDFEALLSQVMTTAHMWGRSEIRGQRSEDRGQRSEVRNQR